MSTQALQCLREYIVNFVSDSALTDLLGYISVAEQQMTKLQSQVAHQLASMESMADRVADARSTIRRLSEQIENLQDENQRLIDKYFTEGEGRQ